MPFRIAGLLLLVLIAGSCREKTDGPYFATGIRIGEVTGRSAIIWVRLTADSIPAPGENPFPVIRYKNTETGEWADEITGNRNMYSPVVSFPEGYDLNSLAGATKGIPGDVKIYYKSSVSQAWSETEWLSVSPENDHSIQTTLEDLQPRTDYELRVISRFPGERSIGESISGKFRTAPMPRDIVDVLFCVSTGQAFADQDAPGGGFKIYDQMLRLDPDFFVHTGDIVYYDEYAKNARLAEWHWSRTYSLPTNVRFHRNVSSYFIKDDHDTWINDCWPGMETAYMGDFTFEQGQKIFLEQMPMAGKTYRTFRWGRDLQIWLMEGRDFRSPNDMPDGPDKSIWGKEQKNWLKKTMEESDATFRILISPTPIVGPDRENKFDNHSNQSFAHEGNEIRSYLAGLEQLYVICGDRHWQYISVDEETGLREYSCGPASNEHAGGWSNDMLMPEHRYLNVTGGFLAVQASRITEQPLLVFSHFDVDGGLLNSDTIQGKPRPGTP